MSVAELLKRVTGRHVERTKARQSEFEKLVADVAKGIDPGAERVDKVLLESGKSPADLEGAVKLCIARNEARAKLALGANVVTERQAIQGRVEELVRVRDAAVAKAIGDCEHAGAPLEGRLLELDQIEQQATRANAFLIETAHSASADSIREQINGLRRQIHEIGDRRPYRASAIENAANEVNNIEAHLSNLKHQLTAGDPGPDKARLPGLRKVEQSARQVLANDEAEQRRLNDCIEKLTASLANV